jgi:hypothetical protein
VWVFTGEQFEADRAVKKEESAEAVAA